MPFALKLPEPWASRGWKAKIRDRERLEAPHVTILHKTSAWRFDLRSERFLDKEPSPREIPEQLLGAVRAKLGLLRQEWDRMFPENRVFSEEREDKRNVESEDE